ncbi:Clp protease N-terminal domain-containing protein [Hoyosella altamirensis]|uniref:ATP-dependent Clp protease ATP-binding subunit ClpA n=1 Tax=Hoyosella altamirensis TaxID=616997 RepID=A0A839RJC6_9ACTN|nr:Clp protease N-terminal domain-containing protein [Hoyosella altamirensis]MBB3036775.1 ATP-dependent Clp protease ATP-binding subunit ClpA [Hoyosella altamirensis]
MFERFTRDSREIVVGAQNCARDLGSPVISAGHLVLSLSRTAPEHLRETLRKHGVTPETVTRSLESAGELGDMDSEALSAIGIDLDAVRRDIHNKFGRDILDTPAPRRGWLGSLLGQHLAFADGAKKALELALREALARKDRTIRPEHILLGVLRANDQSTRALFPVQDTSDRLRLDIYKFLDDAA